MNRHIVNLILMALFLGVSRQLLVAQEAKIARSSAKATPEELRAKIEAALEVVVDVDLVDTPLSEVAKKISSEFDFPVVLRIVGLDLIGITPDDTVTFSISGVRLRIALKLLLSRMDLTYVLQDEALMITSIEEAGDMLETHFYDVTRFISGANDNAIVARTHRLTSLGSRVEALEELIRDTVAPDSWDEYGGTGTMSPFNTPSNRCLLKVSQPEEVHYQLKWLFESLDALQAKTKASPQQASKLPVRVYPITEGVVTADEAKQVLELALEGVDWKEPHYIRAIGQTLVVKQTKEVHWKIVEVLRDLAE